MSQPPPIRHFEDLVPGTVLEFGRYVMSEEEIVAFGRAWDPQPFHTGRDAARGSAVGELIASGWHSCAAIMRMLVDHFVAADSFLPSPGIDELRWLAPVRPADTLSLRVTVIEARASQSRPDRGILRSRIEAFNQRREPVVSFISIVMLRRRGAG